MGEFAVLVIDMFHYDEESQSIIRGFPTVEMATGYAGQEVEELSCWWLVAGLPVAGLRLLVAGVR